MNPYVDSLTIFTMLAYMAGIFQLIITLIVYGGEI